ncbi:SDR family NAD(P)-dependent oxidoreductase, partial [Verrucomicrobiota bacterium]
MTDKTASYDGTLFDLTEKVAIVTGGGGLLGRELCRALASAGAKVVIADNDKNRIESAVDDIRGMYPKAELLDQVLDVTDEDSSQACVDAVVTEFGRIDVLVNSAAIDPKFDKSLM